MKNKTIIIAEAGVNHNGDISIAKKLIDAASKADADYIKFQTFKAKNIVTKGAIKSNYQMNNSIDKSKNQYKMLKSLELNDDFHRTLINHCRDKKIKFISSPFDFDSISYLNQFNLDFFKIPSGEITNYPYLKKLSKIGKPIILSTGMSNLKEIKDAMNVLLSGNLNKNKIFILHCNTSYPTNMEDVNLLAMDTIKNEFNVKVGYSDHTLGFEVSIAAVALGADVIEKHLTLDRKMPGPDHFASLEPLEFEQMVKSIRNINIACKGTGLKEPTQSETKNIIAARKSIVAKKKILKGEILNENNLTIKRPGNGISPMSWNKIIGLKSKKNYEIDDLI